MRELFAKQTLSREDGAPFELRYFCRVRRLDGKPQYGAEIELREGLRRESAVVYGFTDQPMRMLDFLALLSENSVTPCTLQDVMEDILCNF